MAFPNSPTNGQLATVNGIIYQYGSSVRSWTRVVGSIGNLTASNSSVLYSSIVGGNITANGATINGNITRNGKNVVTNYTGNTAPTSPGPGDEWYYRPTDTLYKYLYDGATYTWVSINTALYFANTGAVANTLALRDSGGNLTATNFLGIASSAKYADLAEIYSSDSNYDPGTVVVFGGTKEITVTNISHDRRVAGVISTNPAYLMNSEAIGLPVAFTGRVPCLVKGPVSKGDLLVTSNINGVAEKLNDAEFKPGCVFGKSLATIDNETVTTIEVVVGRY